MKKQNTNGTLTLYFEGEVNSANSEMLASEIEKLIAGEQFSSLVFDFEKVNYVSSAGLRIVLRYKQRYGSLAIKNVSVEVYDIFQMTGFTSIMTVTKAIRKVEVRKDQLIGEGFFSNVYRIDKDTIVKVFKQTDDITEIEKELAHAREAFILGIPTAITFDIVMVDGKYGVQFEMLDSTSLRDEFRDHPELYDKLCKDYANLLKTINTTSTDNQSLPSAKQRFMKKCQFAKQFLTEEEGNKLQRLIDGVKEKNTFVHGDCHVKNILCQNGELFLIDMETLSVGDPIFELAGIYVTYIAFEEASKGNNEVFLGLPADFCNKMLRQTLTYYFGKWDEEAWKKMQLVGYMHLIWWNSTYQFDQCRHDICLKHIRELLPILESVELA